jgi:hypothetical protein
MNQPEQSEWAHATARELEEFIWETTTQDTALAISPCYATEEFGRRHPEFAEDLARSGHVLTEGHRANATYFAIESSARFSSRTLTRGSPKNPHCLPWVF